MEFLNLKLLFFSFLPHLHQCDSLKKLMWQSVSRAEIRSRLCCERVWEHVGVWISISSSYYLCTPIPNSTSLCVCFSILWQNDTKGPVSLTRTLRMTCSFHHPERSYSLLLFPVAQSFVFFWSYLRESFYNCVSLHKQPGQVSWPWNSFCIMYLHSK